MKSVTKTLIGLEDRARQIFEKIPFVQAFLAGVGVIIFWRGVWELLDVSGVTPITSIILGSLILGAVGVFVQTFIGNTIIIKEVKQEEKSDKDEGKSIQKIAGIESTEKVTLSELSAKLDKLIENSK
ncbi:MAG: hypothetical protein WCI52_00905 [bacterium]